MNDITFAEAKPLLGQIICPRIKAALASGQLTCVPSGSGSPCLDLNAVSRQVAQTAPGLVLLEGMGRAIHTNFRASFGCDAVLLGVFKNPRVAGLLGAQMYDSICLFKPRQ